MSKKADKTNVMRLLDQAGIAYIPHWYDPSLTSGTAVAEALGLPGECLFKTLVTRASTGEHFLFVIPGPDTLDLRKAARAAGGRAVDSPQSAGGISYTIRAALDALPPVSGEDFLFFAVADQPWLEADTLLRLVDAARPGVPVCCTM